jgi:hypothetical protein
VPRGDQKLLILTPAAQHPESREKYVMYNDKNTDDEMTILLFGDGLVL